VSTEDLANQLAEEMVFVRHGYILSGAFFGQIFSARGQNASSRSERQFVFAPNVKKVLPPGGQSDAPKNGHQRSKCRHTQGRKDESHFPPNGESEGGTSHRHLSSSSVFGEKKVPKKEP
jgi:hypothetical protein